MQFEFSEVSRDDLMKLAVQSGMLEESCLTRRYQTLVDGIRSFLCRREVGDDSIVGALVEADVIYAVVEPIVEPSKKFSFENASLINKKLTGLCLTILDYSSPGERPRCAYVSLFCAAPATPGAKLGKRFMAFVQDVLFRRGVMAVFLDVSPYAAYTKFYEKMGFRCTKLYPEVASVSSVSSVYSSSMGHLVKIAPDKLPGFFLSFQDYEGKELPLWDHRADLMRMLKSPKMRDPILGETCFSDTKKLFGAGEAKRIASAWTGQAQKDYQRDLAAYRFSVAPKKPQKRLASPAAPKQDPPDERERRAERREEERQKFRRRA